MAEKEAVKAPSKASVAYRNAEKVLRETYVEEFNRILDEEYKKLGEKSPRVKKQEREAAKAAAALSVQEKKRQKAAERFAKAQAELAAAGAEVAKFAPGEPEEPAQTTIDGDEVPHSAVVAGVDDPLKVFSER